MRITRSDEMQLVVVDCPWIIPALAFPTASMMLSFAALAFTRAMSKPDFPWFGTWSGGLWGSLFSGLLSGCLAIAFTFHEKYVFDLAARQLNWRRRTLFSTTTGVVPFDQIAYAVTQCNRDNDGDTFRVALKTDAGLLPLTSVYTSNQRRFDHIRDQINAALKVKITEV